MTVAEDGHFTQRLKRLPGRRRGKLCRADGRRTNAVVSSHGLSSPLRQNSRLQNVSTTAVDSRGFWRTAVNETERRNRL